MEKIAGDPGYKRPAKELPDGTVPSGSTELELPKNEQQYSALLGAIPDPVVVYDAHGYATYINDAFEHTYGWARDELIGRKLDFFVPEEERQPTRNAWGETFQGGTVFFETQRFTKAGERLDIQLRTAILKDPEGRLKASIVIHRDITAAKRAQLELEEAHQELEKRVAQRTAELSELNEKLRREITERIRVEDSLRRSKKRLDLAMVATSDALWDWDLVSNRTYFNRCFYTMLGYRPYELPQSFDTWRQLVHPNDLGHAARTLDRYVKKKVESFEVEYRLRTKQDHWRWILARGKVVERDENGTPIRMVGTHVDITDRKRNEEALRISEAHLREENLRLRSTVKGAHQFCGIIGKSRAMQTIYETILKAASSGVNVIIYGESGTGKERVAHTIHQLSNRGKKEFVTVNCGAIPDALIESEFFGYVRGAFTGADHDKPGYLDTAEGGTLFMDEVGELNLSMQVKLLRAIEGGGYTPIGSRKIKKPDIRIVAATNRDLGESVKQGEFRDDFYYRIHIIPIYLPPLRERQEDIPLLIHHFLQTYTEGRNIPSISETIMRAMQAYHWPGNVRELQNTIHRYIMLKKIDFLDMGTSEDRDLTAGESIDDPSGANRQPLRQATKHFEKTYIERLLREHQWHRSKVAAVLGIDRRTLFRKIKEYGIS